MKEASTKMYTDNLICRLSKHGNVPLGGLKHKNNSRLVLNLQIYLRLGET